MYSAGYTMLHLFLLVFIVDHLSFALTDEEKQIIVDKHNWFRSQTDPLAANMRRLSWDTSLEELASAYAGKCIWEHNQDRGLRGENLFLMTGSSLDVALGMEDWYKERNYYNFTTATCQEGQMCGHYTQIVWASTERVGCGDHFCEEIEGFDEPNVYFLVCNYEPLGNFQEEKPYKEGIPCSDCPGEYVCNESLCEKSKELEGTSTVLMSLSQSDTSTSPGVDTTETSTEPAENSQPKLAKEIGPTLIPTTMDDDSPSQKMDEAIPTLPRSEGTIPIHLLEDGTIFQSIERVTRPNLVEGSSMQTFTNVPLTSPQVFPPLSTPMSLDIHGKVSASYHTTVQTSISPMSFLPSQTALINGLSEQESSTEKNVYTEKIYPSKHTTVQKLLTTLIPERDLSMTSKDLSSSTPSKESINIQQTESSTTEKERSAPPQPESEAPTTLPRPPVPTSSGKMVIDQKKTGKEQKLPTKTPPSPSPAMGPPSPQPAKKPSSPDRKPVTSENKKKIYQHTVLYHKNSPLKPAVSSKALKWDFKSDPSDKTFFGEPIYRPHALHKYKAYCPYPCVHRSKQGLMVAPLYRTNLESPSGVHYQKSWKINTTSKKQSTKRPCKLPGYGRGVYSLYLPQMKPHQYRGPNSL